MKSCKKSLPEAPGRDTTEYFQRKYNWTKSFFQNGKSIVKLPQSGRRVHRLGRTDENMEKPYCAMGPFSVRPSIPNIPSSAAMSVVMSSASEANSLSS